MYAIRSVFGRRLRIPCASVLMALCCHAQADTSLSGDHGQAGAAGIARGLGFVAPDSAHGTRCPEAPGCDAGDVQRGGYLLGLRNFFDPGRLFSRLGLFGRDARQDGHDGSDSQSGAGGNAPGLNLHPLPGSAIEARYGWSGLTYIARDELPLQPGLKTRGVKYALYVDDCARLEGMFGRASGQDRYGLGFAQDNWSVSLATGAGDARMSLHVGYAIPLGQSGGTAAACNVASSAGLRSLRPGAWLDQ